MSRRPSPPYPKNAPGLFYVENECCIACEAPEAEAPDLMDHDERGNFYHCYFKQQPSTPEETEEAILACCVSCCQAVRYGGNDPKVLARFRELGHETSCDALWPLPPAPEQARPQPIADLADGLSAAQAALHPLWDRNLDGGPS